MKSFFTKFEKLIRNKTKLSTQKIVIFNIAHRNQLFHKINKLSRIEVRVTDMEYIGEVFDSRELTLIVFFIVSFGISSGTFPVDLLFLFDEVLAGLLHEPCKVPSL